VCSSKVQIASILEALGPSHFLLPVDSERNRKSQDELKLQGAYKTWQVKKPLRCLTMTSVGFERAANCRCPDGQSRGREHRRDKLRCAWALT
jgi:hypothetical protein